MAAVDRYAGTFGGAVGISDPAVHAVAVSPHDTTELAYYSRALYVGGVGASATMTVITINGETVQFTGCWAGMLIPIRVKQVKATGTTCTGILALD